MVVFLRCKNYVFDCAGAGVDTTIELLKITTSLSRFKIKLIEDKQRETAS